MNTKAYPAVLRCNLSKYDKKTGLIPRMVYFAVAGSLHQNAQGVWVLTVTHGGKLYFPCPLSYFDDITGSDVISEDVSDGVKIVYEYCVLYAENIQDPLYRETVLTVLTILGDQLCHLKRKDRGIYGVPGGILFEIVKYLKKSPEIASDGVNLAATILCRVSDVFCYDSEGDTLVPDVDANGIEVGLHYVKNIMNCLDKYKDEKFRSKQLELMAHMACFGASRHA